MRIKFFAGFFLSCLGALALPIPWANAPIPKPALASGFYPTQVANTYAFFNYSDDPIGKMNAWTDEVSSLVLSNCLISGGNFITNTGMGMSFYEAAFTNTGSWLVGTNFSIWIMYAPWGTVSANSQLFGQYSSSANVTNLGLSILSSHEVTNSINFSAYRWTATGTLQIANQPLGYLCSNVPYSQGGYNMPLWNQWVDAQGLLYLNGNTTTSNIGVPTSSNAFNTISVGGNNAGAGGMNGAYAFNGDIKYLLIVTNRAMTAADVSNCWAWSMTNGVTNVSGGCVAWWKFNDASNGTTLVDSSGKGYTGTLYGSPKPLWTNGLNAVVNQSLQFDGSQNYALANCQNGGKGLLTNSFGTLSFWLDVPPGAAENYGWYVSALGWIVNTNANPGAQGMGPAFGAFSDSTGNCRGYIGQSNVVAYLEGTSLWITNSWHHYVFATDGTNWQDWVDGVKDLNTARSGGTVQCFTDIGNSTGIDGYVFTNWWVALTNMTFGGAGYDPRGGYPWGLQACRVTDVRVYNRILNDAEVDILYRAPMADAIIGSYNY